MADPADIAAEITADVITDAVRRARNAVLAGTAGECEECEWWMPRLVGGLCGFCRDGRPRPPDWEPPPRPDAIVTEPPEEKPAMPAKSIQLPASAVLAIEAVEARAKQLGESLGTAAADLIVAGSQTISSENQPAPAEQSPRQRMFAALDQVAAIAAELLDRPDHRAAMALAEGEIASLRTDLAAETARADAAVGKLDALRAALA